MKTFLYSTTQDDKQMTLVERMRKRMSSGQKYQLYRSNADCIHDEAAARMPGSTHGHWGDHSNKYLDIRIGKKYVRITEGAHPDWWYMVALEDIGHVLEAGGWVPLRIFEYVGYTRTLYEVVGPTITPVSAICPLRIRRAPLTIRAELASCEVYTCGSWNYLQGIAAAWVFSGVHMHEMASLAGFHQHQEACELLGIVGALTHMHSNRFHNFETLVFKTNCQIAEDHVFSAELLSELYLADGDVSLRPLLSMIRLARMLIDGLQRRQNVTVRYVKVERLANLARCIAEKERMGRHGRGWSPDDDRWPSILAMYKRYFSAASAPLVA